MCSRETSCTLIQHIASSFLAILRREELVRVVPADLADATHGESGRPHDGRVTRAGLAQHPEPRGSAPQVAACSSLALAAPLTFVLIEERSLRQGVRSWRPGLSDRRCAAGGEDLVVDRGALGLAPRNLVTATCRARRRRRARADLAIAAPRSASSMLGTPGPSRTNCTSTRARASFASGTRCLAANSRIRSRVRLRGRPTAPSPPVAASPTRPGRPRRRRPGPSAGSRWTGSPVPSATAAPGSASRGRRPRGSRPRGASAGSRRPKWSATSSRRLRWTHRTTSPTRRG